jgi:hypothetical protein
MSPCAAPARSAVAMAKDRARKAYLVCRGDPRPAFTGDRIWAETPEHVALQDATRVETMFLRVAVLLEILIDRRGWPTMVRGLPRLS